MIQHRFIEANGIRLHVAESGSGPLLVLLHGFPELWFSFRHQIEALSDAFHVVAPDLRGYGESEKPSAGYDVETLATDVRGLIDALGAEKAFVCGHDWGGVVAWRLAARAPDVVRKLVILNCPHPAVFMKVLRRSPSQVLRSGYMFLFQVPYLPEAILRFRRGRVLEFLFTRSLAREIAQEELEVYRKAWLTFGALEGGLAYYRTMMRKLVTGGAGDGRRRVSVPTLLVWGEKDWALGPALHEETERHVDAPFKKLLIPSAGHFVHQDAPEEVSRALREFLIDPAPKAVNP